MMYLGETEEEEIVRLPSKDFLTHGVVLGRTGSGKSGLTIALIEEALKEGAHVLVLDPKGDLANLALSLSSEGDFAKWSDDPANARLNHGEGLAQSNLDFDHVEEFRAKTSVKVYSPGKTGSGGHPVNMFPSFEAPTTISSQTYYRVSRMVRSVLSAVAGISDPGDPAVVFMAKAIMRAWAEHRSLPMAEWPGVLTNPPGYIDNFGGMKLNDFYSKKKRTDLARTLIGFQHQAERWMSGEKLDLKKLCDQQTPSASIFTMRHLLEEDRQFFVGMLLSKVVEFMFETDASDDLKLLVVLDEARGYLPPYPHNPPTKDPICTILAQGRAQGIGMLIGTQNPMDLDYKALSNVGTWFLGRLRERDCARDLLSELSSRGVEAADVADVPQRSFLLLDRRGGSRRFRTRWCLNYLFGPMSGDQLASLGSGKIEWVKSYFDMDPVVPEIHVSYGPGPGERPHVVILENEAKPIPLEEVASVVERCVKVTMHEPEEEPSLLVDVLIVLMVMGGFGFLLLFLLGQFFLSVLS